MITINSIEDLPKRIPIFPLTGAVLFPGTQLPLNIFEPRYVKMIDENEVKTRKWWAILAMGTQSAAVDCILDREPQVWAPEEVPPLASILAWAEVAPEPSRVR